jgi:hypothetical protein
VLREKGLTMPSPRDDPIEFYNDSSNCFGLKPLTGPNEGWWAISNLV